MGRLLKNLKMINDEGAETLREWIWQYLALADYEAPGLDGKDFSINELVFLYAMEGTSFSEAKLFINQEQKNVQVVRGETEDILLIENKPVFRMYVPEEDAEPVYECVANKTNVFMVVGWKGQGMRIYKDLKNVPADLLDGMFANFD